MASRYTLLFAALVLAGCAQMQPPAKLPDIPAVTAFKEGVAPWTAAQPADHAPRGDWWTLYGDADLDALQGKLIANSPDLAAALARYQQSQALTDQIRAAQLPTVSGSLNIQRDRQAELRPLRVLGPTSPDTYSSNTVGLDLEYEIDLWGRVRQQVAAGVAADDAARADLASARLSLQAQLADNYIALRGLDRDGALLAEAVEAYSKALSLIQNRFQAGISSGLDEARAQAQVEAARSQLRQSQAQRALMEHAVAALVGEPASNFSLAPKVIDIALPDVPAGLPSTLLERRADIAAAERRVAAANASVGVAKAAVFPSLVLSVLGGYQSSDISHFISAPNVFWAVGPTLAGTLFDGGRKKAEIARTQAVLDENGARYRGVVIGAFQQVEDQLALLQHYGAAAEAEAAALAASQRALTLATNRYREGAASYLEVVTSQTATLQSQRSAADLATRQRRASVQLIRALGGGWQGLSSAS
ncbi:efflux transporter outer membrane subunit [Paucibacter sp. R3-3]|uniref:Efflux transporter outer membrane subunit n=1 Tax=Roseateles agri TaxID=3098619 RepID=A0ABU5DNU4_9BURK|nr:efflux transporter outer membrane subunit [Paucibacter sp. R3-3]MDY0747977.1 efflux transporter outer membrane subunit [Paucibacter sp. R3-3]